MKPTSALLPGLATLALAGSFLVAQTQDVSSADSPSPDAREVSQVRIIRLSQVVEKVELDRNTGRGFEPTLMNLPVVQGNRLRTERGWAEVEFEDNSTLRVTPDTLLDFPTLGRTTAGDTINTLRLTHGTLYVSLAKGKGSDFSLSVGTETLSLPPGSHIRVDVYPAGSEIYVFDGRVTVADASGSQLIQKAHALKFNAPGQPEPLVARDDTPGLYDEWDRTAVKYHSFAPSGTAPYAYGTRDLQAYGQFADLGGGCGQMWTPYFSSASFDPYSNGVWAYYPNAGYSFVSAYPWGWLPYHSGNWSNCGGRWGWQPAGNWHGLKNHPVMRPIKGPVGFRPLQPPTEKQPVGKISLVVVAGTQHITPAQLRGDKFVFSKDSAGIGVPRDAFGNLGKISTELDRKVSVERPVASMPTFVAPANPGTHAGQGTHVASATGPQSRPVATSVGGSSGNPSAANSLWLASGSAPNNAPRSTPPPTAAPVSGGGGTAAASAPGGSHH